jgi:GntR family transcriptional repressor for pyruvate dehydrogenase complex
MEQFELGRGTVREALRLLESEGLIRIKRGPRGGAVVATPDLGHITRSLAALLSVTEAPLWQLTGFRTTLESEAAALASERASDLQRQRLLEAADSETPFDESGITFHQLVADSTNHELYRAVLYTVYQLMIWHHVEEFRDPEHAATMRRAHRRIAAISSGDRAEAFRSMERHASAEERILADAGGLERPIVPENVW